MKKFFKGLLKAAEDKVTIIVKEMSEENYLRRSNRVAPTCTPSAG